MNKLININTNWKYFFDQESKKPYFQTLMNFLTKQYQDKIIYPPQEKIFSCFNFFNYQDLKIVIFGQDPYHQPNQANGIAFSVPENTNLPPSLKNIFEELNNDLCIIRTNGDLTDWARQGILLINTTLTVVQNQPLSHDKIGWEIFINNLIEFININCNNPIFVLLGKKAQEKISLIKNKNLIIKTSHPSPFSYHYGFRNSKIFSQINNLLDLLNKTRIKW